MSKRDVNAVAVRSSEWFGDVRALSPRLAWLANHNVRTHEFVSDPKDMRTFNHLGFGRWIAFVGRSVPPHEDSNRIWANGETEDEALVNLARDMGWRLWNEELAATRPVGAGGVGRASKRDSALFGAAHVEWGTPPDLKEALEKEFRFTLDPCTPGQVWDGRAMSWVGHRVFCNPPYGKTIGDWLAKGPEAELAVFLLPARTDTKWFHDHALKADEIRFFKGRLRFAENHIVPHVPFSGTGAPFPSMLVIFRAGGGGAEPGANNGTCETKSGANSPNDQDQRPRQ